MSKLFLREIEEAKVVKGLSNVRRIADLLSEGRCAFIIVQGLLELPLWVVDSAKVAKGKGYVGRIADLLTESQSAFIIAQGLLELPLLLIGSAKVVEARSEFGGITNLFKNLNCLFQHRLCFRPVSFLF